MTRPRPVPQARPRAARRRRNQVAARAARGGARGAAAAGGGGSQVRVAMGAAQGLGAAQAAAQRPAGGRGGAARLLAGAGAAAARRGAGITLRRLRAAASRALWRARAQLRGGVKSSSVVSEGRGCVTESPQLTEHSPPSCVELTCRGRETRGVSWLVHHDADRPVCGLHPPISGVRRAAQHRTKAVLPEKAEESLFPTKHNVASVVCRHIGHVHGR